MNTSKNTCPLCGGDKESGHTTYSADLGSCVVVVRKVPAEVCSQCGEAWIDDVTAARLEKITNDAREKRTLVEVVGF